MLRLSRLLESAKILRLPSTDMTAPHSLRQIFRMILNDAARGLFLVTHSGLAMVGLAAAAAVMALWLKPQWLNATETFVLSWLREQQVLVSWLPENRLDRATAVDLRELPPKQAAVAEWLARKYRVAPEPLAALVVEAQVLSKSSKLPPNLILAVMAVESNFHPYIQSQAGAQGLMQVMTGIHTKRYQAYGGNMAAFDPRTNMRVGVAVLVDAIKLKGGSVDEGLRFYLGGDAVTEDGGYVAKVLSEQARLDQVAAGVKLPVQ
jgi:soluble lytic murein transglycosylase-like protein